MFFGDKIIFQTAYRSIGLSQAERYGVGFMNKSGLRVDTLKSFHPSYVLVLVLRGTGEYIDFEDNHYPLNPGSCFQRFPGVSHTVLLDPESGWQECFLELGPTMWELLQRSLVLSPVRPVLENSLTPGLVARFSDLLQKFRVSSDMELIRCLPEILDLVQILHDGGQNKFSSEHQELLSRACTFLSEDFSRPADFRAFCRKHGCGYENFRKIFKEKLGISPHRYRIRRRLDEACTLLSGTDLTIAEIALRLGYSSPYEFSAQFKEYMGYSPTRVRLSKGQHYASGEHR